MTLIPAPTSWGNTGAPWEGGWTARQRREDCRHYGVILDSSTPAPLTADAAVQGARVVVTEAFTAESASWLVACNNQLFRF